MLAGATLGVAAALLGPGADVTEAATTPSRNRPRPCRRGNKRCDGRCVDVETDRHHCGRCGHRCGEGKRCHAGACRPSCAAVLTAAGCARDDAGQWRCVTADLGGAVLTGCDLSPAIFDSVDLSGADLSGANLTGDVLFNSLLGGADFGGADLSGVRWEASTCPDGTNADTVGGTCCGNLNGAVPAAGC